MMTRRKVQFKTLDVLKFASVLLMGTLMAGPVAIAEHLGDDPDHDGLQRRPDPHEALRQHDRLRMRIERLGISAVPYKVEPSPKAGGSRRAPVTERDDGSLETQEVRTNRHVQPAVR